MLAYQMKNAESTELASEKYICVNNLGYYENLTNVQTRRERGRVDYQMIYITYIQFLLNHFLLQ
jgi:hypothetical protein